MSFLSVFSKRFRDAGLLDIIVESMLVANGSVNAVLEGRHYNRAMMTHKVVSEALERLRFRSFLTSVSDNEKEEIESILKRAVNLFPSNAFNEFANSETMTDVFRAYKDFLTAKCAASKTFAFWSSYLEMTHLLLSFIRAIRTSDWTLHLECVRQMLPWVAAYDRTFYARYLPIYWCEMTNLRTTHHTVFQSVELGQWTVQQQNRYPFSAVACDQVIEQTLNRDCKTSGGIKGISLNQNAVQRFILSQAERAAITRQCETMAGYHHDPRSKKDLDNTARKRNEDSVERVIAVVEQMVDPFSLDQPDLVNICSGAVASNECEKDLLEAHAMGESAVRTFMEKVCLEPKRFHDTIKRMNLRTFAAKKTSKPSNDKYARLSDREIFTRFIILGKRSDLDLRILLFYSLGPVSYPLSSADGSIAKTDKSALLQFVENQFPCTTTENPPGSVLIIDGMALIHGLPSTALPQTFGALATILRARVLRMASQYKSVRVDVVFDRYSRLSIKSIEHARRANEQQSTRQQILSVQQKLPVRWKNYLQNGKNKDELVEFLYTQWAKSPSAVAHVVAHGSLCHIIDAHGVLPINELYSDHEEADTRLLLHARHASLTKPTAVVIWTPDTDVLFIALSHVSDIPCRLLVETGRSDKVRVLDVTRLEENAGPLLAKCLIGLHVFTGADTTSAFHGRGKKRAYDMLLADLRFQIAFAELGSSFEISDDLKKILEAFVCLLYGQKCCDVNEARYRAFCSKSLSERNLPPTRDALHQHILRSNFQTAVDRRALVPDISAPDPQLHGWLLSGEDNLSVRWITQPAAPPELLRYLHCGCKKTACSTNQCTCRANAVSCTELCSCSNCANTTSTNVETAMLQDDSEDDISDDD